MLEKIDVLRARLGVSYREAREALEAAGGDVVEALVLLEERRRRTRAVELAEGLRELLRRACRTRLRIKKGEQTVLEVPGLWGALAGLGMLASSELALLGAAATVVGMANRYTLELAREPET
jgi:hypothetical protein